MVPSLFYIIQKILYNILYASAHRQNAYTTFSV